MNLIRESLYGSVGSYMVPKCSILPAIWNQYIMQLTATGIIDMLYNKYLAGNAEATSKNGNFHVKTDDSPLGIEQVISVKGISR